MKTGDVFPSNYIKSEDLADADKVVTVKKVVMETMPQEKKDKPVMYFNELDKGLIVNKTNWNKMIELTGKDDSDNWAGFKINLTVVETEYQGKETSGIRIRKAK